jgi:hypothetical protein
MAWSAQGGMRRRSASFAAFLFVFCTHVSESAAQSAPRIEPVWHAEAVHAASGSYATQRAPSPWRPVRVAKWTLAAASAGTALYGFMQNREADDAFSDLERMCQDDFGRCRNRLPGGAYADPAMEAQYQRVRSIDGRARTALVAGQVGVAASVVLFLIDLRNHQNPPNIPYEPNRLEVGAARDGGVRVGARVPLGSGR